jgi:hypothetical protein
MRGKNFRFVSLFFLFVGFLFLLNSRIDITGAIIGISNISSRVSSILGIGFLIGSLGLFVVGGTLERKLEEKGDIAKSKHWIKYPLNKDSIILDVEQEYLNSNKEYKKTSLQEKIEKIVSGGKTIEIPNKRKSYSDQFYEGHASQGGRVIEVPSHISQKGETKGKLVHFGQPANSRYLWVIDEDKNFILGNRQIFKHEMENMNKEKIGYSQRLHKLPHATLAKGKRIYGSGEVLIQGGLIKEVNTHSGHYLPITITPGGGIKENDKKLINQFDLQGKEIFKKYSKKYGWKEVKEGAKYI